VNDFQLYFKLGWQHILSWSSVDHILFLSALILVFRFSDWKELVKLISLFTLAHTSSLLLAVYGVLRVDTQLIETLILWTIIITALSNILISDKSLITRVHYIFSFVFGLIHGLGFATDFKMIIAGQSGKFFPLMEFALGIEAAQILLGVIILTFILLLPKFTRLQMREVQQIISGGIAGFVLKMMF